MCSYFACMCAYALLFCIVLCGPEEGFQFTETGVRNGCEHPCGCWELTPDPLKKQQSESSLQTHFCFCFCFSFLETESHFVA